MKLVLAACAAAALAALSACSRSDASAAAPQIDLPTIAAGEWQWREQVDGKGGEIPGHKCHPERTLWDAMQVGAAGAKACERTIEKKGAGFVAHYLCKTRQTTTTIEATISGDFKTSYRLESVQKFDPPVGSVREQKITVQAERRGDC